MIEVGSGFLPDELLALVNRDTSSECWEWTGNHRPNGYGVYRLEVPGLRNRQIVQAHRLIYELLVGRIPGIRKDTETRKPEPVELDHLCRNRGCVNPAHLEPVTKSENLRRRHRPIP